MPVNSEIFRIYRHLFYGSPLHISFINYNIVNSQESVNRV